MSTTVTHTLELAAVTGSVFETMLGLQTPSVPSGACPNKGLLTAAVHITGTWTGALLVQCRPRQACEFFGRFLRVAPPAELDDDVRDVMGELANMIAGNLKFMLAEGARISVPLVVSGGDDSLRIVGSGRKERIEFLTGAGPFRVTLIEAGPRLPLRKKP